ncbi:hypothetical protein ACFV4F_26785 [Kitasatospora sp. NPDC059722]|uniref:hypothetical protein n=1 Tax=unclassified Kitasatospora TaxID=2633591 RepID=UPI0036B1F53C
MSTKRMGVARKVLVAVGVAAGLAFANVSTASAAGYPEGVWNTNHNFDVHFYSGGCRVEAKFSYTGGLISNTPTWVGTAVRSGERTCNLFVYTVYKGADGKLHGVYDRGRRDVMVAGRGQRCWMVVGVQRPDFTWFSQTLWSTNPGNCAKATF